MEKEIILPIISAIAAMIAAYMASRSHAKVLKVTNDIKEEEKKAQYREPFLRSIYDLQGRLFNIIKMNYFHNMIIKGHSTRIKEYAKNNTAYLIAQCFAWNELIRTELYYLDLKDDKLNKKLSDTTDVLYSEWKYADFQIYPGEQRAIGEVMIENNKCIGYSSFLKKYGNRQEDIINVIYDFIDLISKEPKKLNELTTVHSRLIDVLDILDAHKMKYPTFRDKIT